MRRFIGSVSLFALLLTLKVSVGLAAQQAPQPTIAVMNFSTQGLTGDWWGNFEPGVAVSDLLTDELVSSGGFKVVERAQLGDVLTEHRLDTSGQVDPATAVQEGRLVGAHFLVEGNVLQFDVTGQSGAGAGQVIGGVLGGVAGGLLGVIVGGIHSTRVTIKVAVRVVDAQTGQIVQAFDDEQTQAATSWGAGGISFMSGTFGSYQNSNFVSSTMGHLIDTEAKAVASHLDPAQLLAAAPVLPTVRGRIIAIDEGNIILNIGSERGVSVAAYFDVVKVLQIRDPGTGHYLTVDEPVGEIEVMSVSGETAVARRVSGSPATGDVVQSEQP